MNEFRNAPGFLLVIEGIDGAGKSTQAHMVQERLHAKGLRVLRTREPTAGKWGKLLRESAQTGRLSLVEEVDAFVEDRREHVEQEIGPALRDGNIVIIDRYYFSNMAYQGARGFDPEELRRSNEAFAPEPDLLVLLDVKPEFGLKRVRSRGDEANLFEKAEELAKAREIFNGLTKPYLYRLDATQPPEKLTELIVNRYCELMTQRAMHPPTEG